MAYLEASAVLVVAPDRKDMVSGYSMTGLTLYQFQGQVPVRGLMAYKSSNFFVVLDSDGTTRGLYIYNLDGRVHGISLDGGNRGLPLNGRISVADMAYSEHLGGLFLLDKNTILQYYWRSDANNPSCSSGSEDSESAFSFSNHWCSRTCSENATLTERGICEFNHGPDFLVYWSKNIPNNLPTNQVGEAIAFERNLTKRRTHAGATDPENSSTGSSTSTTTNTTDKHIEDVKKGAQILGITMLLVIILFGICSIVSLVLAICCVWKCVMSCLRPSRNKRGGKEEQGARSQAYQDPQSMMNALTISQTPQQDQNRIPRNNGLGQPGAPSPHPHPLPGYNYARQGVKMSREPSNEPQQGSSGQGIRQGDPQAPWTANDEFEALKASGLFSPIKKPQKQGEDRETILGPARNGVSGGPSKQL